MKLNRFFPCAGFVLILSPTTYAISSPPSYAKHIKPLFGRYCLECHHGEEPKGGLNLETYKSLSEGGDNGAVLTPGKAAASRIVRLVEHKDKPFMPPKKAKQPRPDEVAAAASVDRRRGEGGRCRSHHRSRHPAEIAAVAAGRRPGVSSGRAHARGRWSRAGLSVRCGNGRFARKDRRICIRASPR